MLNYIIKFYFLSLCTIYICLKIMNPRLNNILFKIGVYIFSFTISVLTYLVKIHIPEFSHVIQPLLIWIFMAFLTTYPQASLIATTISFGISYGLFAVSGFIVVIIVSPFLYNATFSPYPLVAILTAILQILFTFSLLKIKRFCRGLPSLFSTKFINVATIISLLFIIFLMCSSTQHSKLPKYIFTFLLFVLTLAILIYWWQAQLTKSYRRSLQLRELESLRTEAQEKDKIISELTKQNEELGRLIHKDNKLIPAMHNAVCELLISDFKDEKKVSDKCNILLSEIQELANSRKNIISEIYATKTNHYSTGITSLDILLDYMNKRAQRTNIHFSVHLALNLHDYVPNIIATDDLSHLLSDLLENAFIAVSTNKERVVQLQFYSFRKYFVIEVADNGIPFEAMSLANLGLVQLTTHAKTGGSGIGLMNIWKLKEKYRATLHIEEYETAAPYTKKILLTFDKKNRYSVLTSRKDEIAQHSKRIDLQIYEKGLQM